MKQPTGYTLVELLIVIVIVGVLAAISVSAFGMVQADSRDKERHSNAVLLSEALEKYYEKNGEYPSVAAVTDTDITSVKTKLGLTDVDVLVMPKSPLGTATSLTASDASVSKLAYNGESVNVSESDQCQTNINGGCDQFKLEWIDEQGHAQAIDSRHTGRPVTQILSLPTAPSITVTYVASVIRGTVSGSVCDKGIVEYKIVVNNMNIVPDWSTVSWQTTLTKDVASPVSDTTYYGFAIARCVSGSSAAENPTIATDSYYYALAGTPTMSASWSGTSAVGTTSFSPACGAGLTAKYYIEYKIDTTAAAGSWVPSGWTTTPAYIIPSATSSNPRMFNFRAQVRCDNGASAGPASVFSNIDSLTSAPVAPVVTDSSTSSATTWTWPGVACPLGTSPVYTGIWTGNYNAYPAMTATVVSGKSLTSTTQGFTYGLQVKASCGITSSKILASTSNNSTYLRPIAEAPFNVGRGGIKTYRPSGGGSTTVYATARLDTVTTSANCPSGTTRYVQWGYRINNTSFTGAQDGRAWPGSTPQYFYYTSDLDDNDEFEALFYIRCYNATTGVLGDLGAAPYRFDRYGNLHLVNSTGDYQVYCDQGGNDSNNVKEPTWCQTGYTFNDELTGTCTTTSAYCWSKITPIGSYSWGWSAGYPNPAPYRPSSTWAQYD